MKTLLSLPKPISSRIIFYEEGENEYFNEARNNRTQKPDEYQEMIEKTETNISETRENTDLVLSKNNWQPAPHAWSHKRR